ncbi:MAG: monovalent cation/H(+) antiporter subunit G [Devosia sp.]|jgi:multicomponent K+:H+ antiporter subunit G|nr:monovalent cation/H(+) antiporter subunit G [Devosia sp.]
MSQFDTVPLWAALAVSVCLVIGAAVTLVGTIGLARFTTFYERIHAPTLGTSFGAGFVLLGSMIFFTVTQARPVLHELLILVFIIVTTPVTLMLLARAALYRDRAEGNGVAPNESSDAEQAPR